MNKNPTRKLETDNRGTPSSRKGLFYGWVIVAAGVLILTTSFGIYYSFGVFFTSLREEFSWSRATTSSIFSLYLLMNGLVSIAAGRALDRFGPKIVVIFMGGVCGLSLVLTSMIQHSWQLFFTYSVLLSIGTGAMYLIVMSTGSRWFLRKRAAALGVIGAGANFGAVLIAPLGAWLISNWHWRTAYLILGLIAWSILLPAAFFLKKDPSEIGEGMDGETFSGAPSSAPGAIAGNFSLSKLMKTRNFLLFFLILFSYSFSLHMVLSHLVPRLEDMGASPVRAASILSLMTAAAIPFRLLGGVVSDRFDKTKTASFFAVVYAAAMLLLACSDRMWMIYLFVILHGMAHGGIDPPIVALVGDVFGLARIGAVMGLLMIAWGLGSASGPYISGLVFDHMGGYGWAFFSGAAAMAMAAACTPLVKADKNAIS